MRLFIENFTYEVAIRKYNNIDIFFSVAVIIEVQIAS